MAILKLYCTPDDVQPITMFNGFHAWLSNFYECDVPLHVNLDGTEYDAHFSSAEAAFQACKCVNYEDFKKFETLGPKEAKALGRKIQLRDDWEDSKLSVMSQVLINKFTTNIDLAEMLIDTYPKQLIEGNTWNDTFWGVCNGKGNNMLGKILMSTRMYLIHTVMSHTTMEELSNGGEKTDA